MRLILAGEWATRAAVDCRIPASRIRLADGGENSSQKDWRGSRKDTRCTKNIGNTRNTR